jgi:hypothetical protein
MPNTTFSLPPATLKKLRSIVPNRQRSHFVTESIEKALTIVSRKKAITNREKMLKLAKKWGFDQGPTATEIIREMRDTRY